MKVCCRCHIEKPHSEFFKDKSRRDGYEYRCKLCELSGKRHRDRAAYHKEYLITHADLIRENRWQCKMGSYLRRRGASMQSDDRVKRNIIAERLFKLFNKGLISQPDIKTILVDPLRTENLKIIFSLNAGGKNGTTIGKAI